MIAARIPSSVFASKAKKSPWILAKPVTVCEPAVPASNSCSHQSREHYGAPVSYRCYFSKVLDDISVNGTLATVTEAQPRRTVARGGKLDMNIDYVKRVSASRRLL